MEKDLALLIAKLSAPVVGKIVEPLVDWIKRKGKNGITTAETVLVSFDEYVNRMKDRHGVFHSFVFPNNGKLLRDFYEPLYLTQVDGTGRSRKPICKVDKFPSDIFEASPRFLIVDSAGMGKSTLLKYIFLSILESKDKVPLFVELRKLNGGISIESFFLAEINGSKNIVDRDLLNALLDSGKFAIFLDGFDELSSADKARVASEITTLISNHSKNYFIVSSRDEPGLVNLFGFRRYGIDKLNKSQAESLIKRLSPTREQAIALCEKLESRSESSLREFLTSPLLVSLLVKSFVHAPILPVRLSEFYRQVFDALYQTHDASKELCGFVRAKESGLDLDSFHRVLRSLGIITYIEGVIEYSRDDLMVYIKNAQDLCGEKAFKPSDFFSDLLRAVPLFVQEGGSTRWAHKSLQEYFAGAYICLDSKEDEGDLLSQIYDRGTYAKDKGLLDFCCDIDSKSFKKYILNRLLEGLLKSSQGKYDIGFDWLSEVDKKSRISSTLLKQINFLVRKRSSKGLMATMEKYRPSVMSDLLSEQSQRITIRIPFCFDKNMNPVFDDATPIKYVAEFLMDQNYILISLASERLGYHKLTKFKPDAARRWNFSGVPTEIFLPVTDDPRSPLSSNLAFYGIQAALNRVSFAVVNVDEIGVLLSQLTSDEDNGKKIKLKFS